MQRALDLAMMRGAQYADARIVDTKTESLAVKDGGKECVQDVAHFTSLR